MLKRGRTELCNFVWYYICSFRGYDIYYNGSVYHKQFRTCNCIKKKELTQEDIAYLVGIDVLGIYEKKLNATRERPARSYEVNLYGGSYESNRINKPYHYFSGK